MTGDAMAVHESDVGDVRLLEVFGELDLATAPRLCSLLDAARIQRVKRLVVDLTGVDFCDSTGLRALMGASTELRVGGGRLAVAVLPDSGGRATVRRDRHPREPAHVRHAGRGARLGLPPRHVMESTLDISSMSS